MGRALKDQANPLCRARFNEEITKKEEKKKENNNNTSTSTKHKEANQVEQRIQPCKLIKITSSSRLEEKELYSSNASSSLGSRCGYLKQIQNIR